MFKSEYDYSSADQIAADVFEYYSTMEAEELVGWFEGQSLFLHSQFDVAIDLIAEKTSSDRASVLAEVSSELRSLTKSWIEQSKVQA